MNKKLKILVCSAIIILCLCSAVVAHATAIENGLQWLKRNQNADFSWGDTTALESARFVDTAEVINTFNILNVKDTGYSNAVSWFSSVISDDNYMSSLRLLALSNSGIDLTQDLDRILNSINEDGAWGGDSEHKSIIVDTTFNLLALKSVNHPDLDTISSALFYLTNHQNADGGFGSYAGDDSSVYMTAVTLNALISYKDVFDLQSEINKAVSYLLAHQNPDGNLGEGTVYETALAFIALIESGSVGAENYAALQNTIAYLTSTQLPNGSWDDDPYSTNLAITACDY